MHRGILLLIALVAAQGQGKVEYMGGTVAQIAEGTQGTIDVSDDHYLAFYPSKAPKKGPMRIAYSSVNLVEYGQQVDRRLALAVVSPLFLLSKSRKHFLTIGYSGEDGQQQALVFRVDKNGIRATLVALEARTGQKIQYQDEEARKAGK